MSLWVHSEPGEILVRVLVTEFVAIGEGHMSASDKAYTVKKRIGPGFGASGIYLVVNRVQMFRLEKVHDLLERVSGQHP